MLTSNNSVNSSENLNYFNKSEEIVNPLPPNFAIQPMLASKFMVNQLCSSHSPYYLIFRSEAPQTRSRFLTREESRDPFTRLSFSSHANPYEIHLRKQTYVRVPFGGPGCKSLLNNILVVFHNIHPKSSQLLTSLWTDVPPHKS